MEQPQAITAHSDGTEIGDAEISSSSIQQNGHVPTKPLHVTLLSGFLGSGKTTLLQHILMNAQGLRIAVIVNDIGAINIDAKLIRRSTHSFTRTQERLVELQNGCICCTLRGDLVEQLVDLARTVEQDADCAEVRPRFDYVLVESSGISEPEQVAETFDPRLLTAMVDAGEDLDEDLVKALGIVREAGGMEKFARLDTTVTVIDAFSFHDAFNTTDMLSNRRNDVDKEDERHVSHLMVDQVEFADVIILNKVGSVSSKTRDSIMQIIKSLNHRADVIETNYGKVDVRMLMNTSRFDMDVAQTGAGWLQDLNDLVKTNVNGRKTLAPKPETEEYGINNFVYARRHPMHPRRLFDLIHDKFIMEDTVEGLKEDEDMMDAEEDVADHNASNGESNDEEMSASPEIPDKKTILANKSKSALFSRLFRSKGGVWLATRPFQSGDWSQAGAILNLQGGHDWYCLLPREEWSGGNDELDELIAADIVEPWGDRQQQIVFIGEHLDRKGIEEALDKCLLTEDEMVTFKKIMEDKSLADDELMQQLLDAFDDGFPPWDSGDGDEDDSKMQVDVSREHEGHSLDGDSGHHHHHHHRRHHHYQQQQQQQQHRL